MAAVHAAHRPPAGPRPSNNNNRVSATCTRVYRLQPARPCVVGARVRAEGESRGNLDLEHGRAVSQAELQIVISTTDGRGPYDRGRSWR